MAEISKPKLVFLIILTALANMVAGMIFSILSPFYPAEAERKGATPSQYGFVFGISSMVSFVFAPIFGHYGAQIGPKMLYNSGTGLNALVGFCLGFLTYIQTSGLFIGLSYFLEAMAGVADVAMRGAMNGIFMKIFPTMVARILAFTQMFLGLGLMLGPLLGTLLFEIGGFKLPFIVVGSFGMLVSLALFFVIPKTEPSESKPDGGSKKITLTDIVKAPSIVIPLIDNFVVANCNGIFASMLQPHLASAGASASQIGITFSIRGLLFMLANPCAGWICDHIPYPSSLSVVGNIIVIISFILVGPLPFIPLEPSFTFIIIAAALSGIGRAIVMVTTFGRAQGAASRLGYEKEMNTYLLISGMWTSSLYLGNFVGPTISGIAVDAFGFRNTSVIFFSSLLVLLIMDLLELGYNVKTNKSAKNIEYQELK